MRGSPLLRTFLTAIGLGLAAWPLWRISRSNAAPSDLGVTDATMAVAPAAVTSVPFQLQLSAAARHIELRDENAALLWQASNPQDTEFVGDLKRLPKWIALEISWSSTSAPRHFAKLQLDVPGQESLTHVFDASGEIDDIWELP